MLTLGSQGVTADEVIRVARDYEEVTLGADAVDAMERAVAHVRQHAASDEAIYGVTTGFGALATTHIEPELRRELQHSVIRSHAAGMGDPVDDEIVRAMILLRARTLAMGYSGVRPIVVERMLDLLNQGLTPIVPAFGSLGASGDLAPLAHVGLVLLGEGEVRDRDGTTRPASECGVEPLALDAKEGLSLINGTDGMLGMLVLADTDLAQLLDVADIAAAMSIEALLGTDRTFAEDVQQLRPHPGLRVSAANLRELLAGSPIVASHRTGDERVQDAYSLRCAPQVTGAARDTLAFARTTAERELLSAVDNPSVMSDGRIESNGNFHGAPLAYALDFLAIVATDVASIAERRVDRLLDHTRSQGLPPFLADRPGVDSGLMIAQYTAAAMVSDNKSLSMPSSVDSVPTSGMQEDHVSMGWNAGLKLRVVLENLRRVLAVELLAAARGLELRAPLQPAAKTGAVVRAIREVVPGLGPDRPMAPELAAVDELVRTGAIVAAAQREA